MTKENKYIKEFKKIQVSDVFLSELIYKVLGAGNHYSTMPVARGIVTKLQERNADFILKALKSQRKETIKKIGRYFYSLQGRTITPDPITMQNEIIKSIKEDE